MKFLFKMKTNWYTESLEDYLCNFCKKKENNKIYVNYEAATAHLGQNFQNFQKNALLQLP